MKINVFHISNDTFLQSLPLFQESNITAINIRSIHDTDFFNPSVVLLTHHSTNRRVIRYIRQKNVLTPIILISKEDLSYREVNGTIHPNDLTFNHLASVLRLFPQQYIWNYAFTVDQNNRLNKMQLA